jgi:hypothetical protein
VGLRRDWEDQAMHRLLICCGVLLAVALAAGEPAQAQFSQPFPTRPSNPVSPYLNLLRGGNPAANYFLGVLPEMQRREQLQQPVIPDITGERRPGIDELDDFIPRLPETGHGVRFLNYGSFYQIGNAPKSNLLNPLARPVMPLKGRR